MAIRPYIFLLSKILVVAGLQVLLVMNSWGAPALHMDKNKVAGGCAACHYRSYLRTGGGSEHCLYCHGNANRRLVVNRSVPAGILPSGAKPLNVEAEFKKQFRHPVFDAKIGHRSGEVLPELDPKASRHAVCMDCHNPHFLTVEKKFVGIAGKKTGLGVTAIEAEKDLCYRCHADSANLPVRATNKKIEFQSTNPSFHPLESEGKNLAVVSLIRPYREKKVTDSDISRLLCSDCHGSDSVISPRGPHGSINEFILVENYSTKDLQFESAVAYALCYKCHNRTSILANESFKFHSKHIAGKDQILPAGTSCYTCHNSHGSTDNKYLIKFNQFVVKPTANGQLKFVEKGTYQFSGECYLNCHGVEHSPKSY